MRRSTFPYICIIVFIAIISFSANLYSEEKKRNISFIYYKSGVQKVEIVGDFGKDKKIKILPMHREGENKWVLNLSLKPGFYCYRYLLDRKYWRLDPNKKGVIESKIGNIKGKFSFLEVYPKEYINFVKMAEKLFKDEKKDWTIKVLIETAKLFPEELAGYKKSGRISEKNKLFGFAADACMTGLEENPDAHDLRYLLTVCYEREFIYTGDIIYKRKANIQWLTLKKVEEYYNVARRHLLIKYAK